MTRDPEAAGTDLVAVGPVKILLDDTDLPSLAALEARVGRAHLHGRGVAVHCVSAVQLILALAAGVGRQDRIEHASVVPADVIPLLRAAGPVLILQPGLVWGRGDRFLREVDDHDADDVHRLRTLIEAGLRVAFSSDAPYGPLDPWIGVRAASDRLTAGGVPFGEAESISPLDALALSTSPMSSPGTPVRLDRPAEADLVILDDDWPQVGQQPRVLSTFVGGRVVHGDRPP